MKNDYRSKEVRKLILFFVVLMVIIIMFGFFLPTSSFKSAYQQFLAPIFVAALTFSFQPKLDSVRKKIDDNEKEEKDLKKKIESTIREMYANYYFKLEEDAEEVLNIRYHTSISRKEFDFKTNPDGKIIEETVNNFSKTIKKLKTQVLIINGTISGRLDVFDKNLVQYCSKLEEDVDNIISDIEFLNHNIAPERRKGYHKEDTDKHVRCIFGRIKGLHLNVNETKSSFENVYNLSKNI